MDLLYFDSLRNRTAVIRSPCGSCAEKPDRRGPSLHLDIPRDDTILRDSPINVKGGSSREIAIHYKAVSPKQPKSIPCKKEKFTHNFSYPSNF